MHGGGPGPGHERESKGDTGTLHSSVFKRSQPVLYVEEVRCQISYPHPVLSVVAADYLYILDLTGCSHDVLK